MIPIYTLLLLVVLCTPTQQRVIYVNSAADEAETACSQEFQCTLDRGILTAEEDSILNLVGTFDIQFQRYINQSDITLQGNSQTTFICNASKALTAIEFPYGVNVFVNSISFYNCSTAVSFKPNDSVKEIGHLSIDNSKFINSGNAGPVLDFEAFALDISNTVFSGTFTTVNGIGLDDGYAAFLNTTFSGYLAKGGSINSPCASLLILNTNGFISNSTFDNNRCNVTSLAQSNQTCLATPNSCIFSIGASVIFVSSKNVSVEHTRFTKNSGGAGSALAVVGSSFLTIYNSFFEYNFASNNGAAIFMAGYPNSIGFVNMTQVYFDKNEAELGGAVYLEDVLLYMDTCYFYNNVAYDEGVLYITDSSDAFHYFYFSYFENNTNGAVVMGGAKVNGSTFTGNSNGGKDKLAAGLTCRSSSRLQIYWGVFMFNKGGALYAKVNDLLLDNTMFSGNDEVDIGGAIYFEPNDPGVYASIKMDHAYFFTNNAFKYGAILYAVNTTVVDIFESVMINNYCFDENSTAAMIWLNNDSFICNSLIQDYFSCDNVTVRFEAAYPVGHTIFTPLDLCLVFFTSLVKRIPEIVTNKTCNIDIINVTSTNTSTTQGYNGSTTQGYNGSTSQGFYNGTTTQGLYYGSTTQGFYNGGDGARNVALIVSLGGFALIAGVVLFLIVWRRRIHRRRHPQENGTSKSDSEDEPLDPNRSTSTSPSPPHTGSSYSRGASLSSSSSSVLKASIEMEEIESSYILDVVIGKEIGAGAFGTVYEGSWHGAKVAVKALVARNFSELTREAFTMKQLSHPNIVQFLGIFKDSLDNRFMVTEFVEGGNLEALLRRQPDFFKISDLIRISMEIASGMRLLEQKGIIHRDLASRNILVDATRQDYRAKVSDFGMSRIAQDYYTAAEKTSFPIKWSSPEVIKYNKYSSKSDVWAMGVTLWEIFSCAEVPYATMTNREAAEWVLAGNRLPIPASAPEPIAKLITWCWAAEPQTRPSFLQIYNVLKHVHNPCDVGENLLLPSQSSYGTGTKTTSASASTSSGASTSTSGKCYTGPSALNSDIEEDIKYTPLALGVSPKDSSRISAQHNTEDSQPKEPAELDRQDNQENQEDQESQEDLEYQEDPDDYELPSLSRDTLDSLSNSVLQARTLASIALQLPRPSLPAPTPENPNR